MTTPTSTAISRARPRAIGVAWLGAALALLVACSAASSSPGPLPAREDVYQFDSFEQMAATADLVVRAEVSSSEEGRVAGEPGPDGNGDLQFFDFSLSAVETLKGTTPGQLIVELDEIWQPFHVGDEGIFFLEAIEGRQGAYILISSTGAFILQDDKVHASNPEYEWVSPAESMSSAEFVEFVKQAIAADAEAVPPAF